MGHHTILYGPPYKFVWAPYKLVWAPHNFVWAPYKFVWCHTKSKKIIISFSIENHLGRVSASGACHTTSFIEIWRHRFLDLYGPPYKFAWATTQFVWATIQICMV